ncbi:MAG: hypothetical protein EXS11_04140 [Gemmataceae bacterium]|nr:hypothetical protein [Gemmataceae bacterium]
MANQEHQNESNTKSDWTFWLPIGAGVGVTLGAAMGEGTGQVGIFVGVGVAVGMMLVSVVAVILRKRS